MMYKLCTIYMPDCVYKTSDLEFLIKKVEFFYSIRAGVRAKPRVICCKTVTVVYE